jgi:hypothetical protein
MNFTMNSLDHLCKVEIKFFTQLFRFICIQAVPAGTHAYVA